VSTLEVVRYRDRLDHLFSQADRLGAEPELLAHWSRYLCVLTSGFLESSVRAILSSYAKKKASPQAAGYVSAQLARFQNASMERIRDVTGNFSASWLTVLNEKCEGEPADAVDSIVSNRHQIAHGESVGISFVVMKRYYEAALKVVETLEQICDTA
jgi:hypothetical protein